MAKGLHGKNLAQSETLCTWRSSLRGTWEVSSMPGLMCWAGSGTRSTGLRQVQALIAQAAARSSETICVTIGEILRAFTPTECATGYAQS
jgi:hypothetical protein